MEVSILKKQIEEAKKLDTDGRWYFIVDSGERYNHYPPYSRIELDEGNKLLKAIYYENGNGPGGSPIVMVSINTDVVNTIGTGIPDKTKLSKILKDIFKMGDKDIAHYIQQIFGKRKY